MCTKSQRELRSKVCDKAKAYVARAPADGYPSFLMKRFSVKGRRSKEKGACIDLEITTGHAFCG
ncbi:MAG: hypothetical protein KC731_35185 [Myxococcales bacterium]|nr:hypothetical protein [Myxococcales bacterium]